MRIGILGGSFDPPHFAHLLIAEQAREQLGLDKVLFIPAFIPPHKQSEAGAKPSERFRMVQLAIRGNRHFETSRIELNRKGISYTVDTLNGLKQKQPEAEFFIIVGSDNLTDFRDWKSPQEILEKATLAVYERPGFEIERAIQVSQIHPVKLLGERIDISSSTVRRRVKEGKSIRYLVPEAVRKFILKNKIYRVDDKA